MNSSTNCITFQTPFVADRRFLQKNFVGFFGITFFHLSSLVFLAFFSLSTKSILWVCQHFANEQHTNSFSLYVKGNLLHSNTIAQNRLVDEKVHAFQYLINFFHCWILRRKKHAWLTTMRSLHDIFRINVIKNIGTVSAFEQLDTMRFWLQTVFVILSQFFGGIPKQIQFSLHWILSWSFLLHGSF